MIRICNLCNIKKDKNNYLKDRTVCKSCYNKNRRKDKNNNTLIQNQQPKNDNVDANKNTRALLVEPSFSGKTFLMLKILSQMPDRGIYIFTNTPPEPYSNFKINIEEIGGNIKPLSEYESAIIVFDNFLGSSNSRNKDQFFNKW